MSVFSLIGVEFQKIRRSKILLLLTLAAIILWLPSLVNAHMNFEMEAEGISPENNFFIQGFMGMAWFMLPASMIVSTVLLNMTERNSRGLLKMRSLPIRTARLCLAKFMVLVALEGTQLLMTAGMYYVSAAIASRMQEYSFALPPPFVWRETGILFLAGIPMLAVFWLLSVWLQTPIFSTGLGLASIVPSVLMINTKVWFLYPMSYPFFVITAEYGKLASNLDTAQISLFPWLPVAAGITVACLFIACLRFGQVERSSSL